jgi:hypothetical protein
LNSLQTIIKDILIDIKGSVKQKQINILNYNTYALVLGLLKAGLFLIVKRLCLLSVIKVIVISEFFPQHVYAQMLEKDWRDRHRTQKCKQMPMHDNRLKRY